MDTLKNSKIYRTDLDGSIEIKLNKNGYNRRTLFRMKQFYNVFSNEKALYNLTLEDIESFMHELGNNFSFIGSEYKIKIGDNYHKIDLLLFNIKYNSYVVVELKILSSK